MSPKTLELEEILDDYLIDELAYRMSSRMNTLLAKGHSRATSNDGQNIANNSWQTVIYEDEEYDDQSEYNAATGVFTAKQGGRLHIHASVEWAASATWGATELAIISVYQNAAAVAHLDLRTDFSGANILVKVTGGTTIEVAEADTVEIKVYQNSGGGLALQGDGDHNYVCFDWLM